jgi:UDP-2,3-diacylglucosamine pyrophosphatase LpxH
MVVKVFISDLHLGCGDPREDFLFIDRDTREEELRDSAFRRQAMARMHEMFGKFIEYVMGLAAAGEMPELVMLGDILDLLQVEPVEEEFCKPARLQRIIEAHEPFFTALGRFMNEGGKVTYVIGNHDHELMDRQLFGYLSDVLPGINAGYKGKPLAAYMDDEHGIYAEHGNQLDPLNRFSDFDDPDELPVGSAIVLNVVNPFEPTHPLFDNIQGTRETLWYASSRLVERHAPELLGQLQEHQNAHGGVTSTLISHLLYILVGKGVINLKPGYLPLISEALMAAETLIRRLLGKKKKPRRGLNEIRALMEASQEDVVSRARDILARPEKADLLASPPDTMRFFLLGHTHSPMLLRTEDGTYANCGCWRPRAVARYRKVFRLRQTLNFALLKHNSAGELALRLKDFAKMRK